MFLGLLELWFSYVYGLIMSDNLSLSTLIQHWLKHQYVSFLDVSQSQLTEDITHASNIVGTHSWLDWCSNKPKNIQIHQELGEIWLKQFVKHVLPISLLGLGEMVIQSCIWFDHVRQPVIIHSYPTWAEVSICQISWCWPKSADR